jgi:hypothetical protein
LITFPILSQISGFMSYEQRKAEEEEEEEETEQKR